jgi:hypothetical protein
MPILRLRLGDCFRLDRLYGIRMHKGQTMASMHADYGASALNSFTRPGERRALSLCPERHLRGIRGRGRGCFRHPMSRSLRGSKRSSPSRRIPIRSFRHSSATDLAWSGPEPRILQHRREAYVLGP